MCNNTLQYSLRSVHYLVAKLWNTLPVSINTSLSNIYLKRNLKYIKKILNPNNSIIIIIIDLQLIQLINFIINFVTDYNSDTLYIILLHIILLN